MLTGLNNSTRGMMWCRVVFSNIYRLERAQEREGQGARSKKQGTRRKEEGACVVGRYVGREVGLWGR